MKIKILGIIAVFSVVSFLLLPQAYNSVLQAAGTQTTSDINTPGSVTVNQDEEGVLYLGTETTPGTSATGNITTTLLNKSKFEVPTGFAEDIGVLINSILSLVMVIVALLVFLYLIWGGFEWITSGGDKGKIDQARQKLVAAIVGAILVASSYAVLLLILNFLGFDNLNDVFNNIKTIDGSDPIVETSPTPSPSASPITYSEGLDELIDN
jgi:hypothetical protein